MKYDINMNVIVEADTATEALTHAGSLVRQVEYNDYAKIQGVNINSHWEPPPGGALGNAATPVGSASSLEDSTGADEEGKED